MKLIGVFLFTIVVSSAFGQELCSLPPPTPTPECGPNATYNSCGTACPATCENPIPPNVCTKQCVGDCFCNPGYLKNGLGICVPAKQCACDTDKEYRSCGSACPPRCGDKEPRFCTLQCVSGCFCRGDLVLNAAGKCVPRSKCPPITT